MKPLQSDLSIYNKLNLENPPVGMKFLLTRPKGMEQLDKTLSFCEMLKEAYQRGTPFYFGKENENCVGKEVLGMEDMPPFVEGGLVGVKLDIYQEPRANNSIYQYIYKFGRGIVNYVAYATLDKLAFEPDLLILMATPSQAEIVLRAMSYSTGELWEPRLAPVLGCSWIYAYPYQSGKVNFMVTGMTFGMKSKQVFSEGWILISIPYHWIPTITQNLHEMKWVPPSYTDGREKFLQREQRVFEEASKEAQNP